jgi:hypothetical protein
LQAAAFSAGGDVVKRPPEHLTQRTTSFAVADCRTIAIL